MKKQINRDGRIISFSESGTGPVLVLIHGFMESGEIWQGMVEFFSKKYRVIVPDLPGHGGSDTFSDCHTMEFMAECVKQCLGSSQQFVIVGHSMGGYVALAIAELYPEMCNGLVLFHSTPTADSDSKKEDRLRAIEVVKANKKEYITALIPKLYAVQHRTHLSSHCEKMKEIANRMSAEGIIAAIAGMRIRPDRSEVLKSKNYDSMIIAGRQDEIIPFDLLQMIAAESAKVQLAELTQSGHMGFAEQPDHSLAILSAFIDSCFGK